MAKQGVARPNTVSFDRRLVLAMLGVVLAVAAGVTYLAISREWTGSTSGEVSMPWQQNVAKPAEQRLVSELEVPVTLVMHIEEQATPGDGEAGKNAVLGQSLNQPGDTAALGDRLYVLDTGNGRLVELDRSGKALRALDASVDEQLTLHGPMAMAVHEDRLYIADSGAQRVVIANPNEGHVEKILTVNKLNEDNEAPRPIGIAVAATGDVFVSDANNQRVLRVTDDGAVSSFVGSGQREAGNYGLNTPGALTFDREGNLYVVDILNSRVMKYGPDGQFLLQIGQRGDTAGTLSRPKGVAVDDKGNIYVSDSLLAAVQVFDAEGKYSGLIGRKEPGNKDSESIFTAPAEIKIVNGRLYVTDRLAGPFVFDLD